MTLRDLYWKWRLRRLERWAARNEIPPRPATEDLLKRTVKRQAVLWCRVHDCQVIQVSATNRAWCVMGDDLEDEDNCWVRVMNLTDEWTAVDRNTWMF